MSLLKNITEEQFRKLIQNSYSKSQVIRSLGLKPSGANYGGFDFLIKKWNIDCSHFTGRGHLLGKTHNWSKKIPLQDIISNEDISYSSNKLRIRLIKEGILHEICNSCKMVEWMGSKIPLELEHKNGNKFDNRLENLELLCPNCHARTQTYRGKNKNYSKLKRK